VSAGDVVGIGIHTGNAVQGYDIGKIARARGAYVVFGGIHAGSAPLVDLVPLAFLGFALCVLYRRTGSLYPCIATHVINNSIAFGGLENWTAGQTVLLMLASLATVAALALLLRRSGVIGDPPLSPAAPAVSAGA